jgi:hypothetical protein
MIGYGRQPDFEVQPVGAPGGEERLAWAMLTHPAFKEACEKEGLHVDWGELKRIVGGGTSGGRSNAKEKGGQKKGIWSVGVWSKL